MKTIAGSKATSDWGKVRIGDALRLINGRAFKPTEWRESGIPIVRIQNLNNAEAPFNYYKGDLPEKFLLNSGDLLFAWSGTPGTSFGAHIWRGGKAWLNQHIFKVMFDEADFDKKFLQLAINQNLNEYIRAAHGGAGLAHITKGRFEQSELVKPTLDEQRDIVAEIEKQFSRLDEAVANLKRVKANLKCYKAAVLKAAVEGKLTEDWRKQHPNVEPASKLLERILAERRAKWSGRGKYKEPISPDGRSAPSLPEKWCWLSVDAIAFVTKLAGFEYTKYVKYDQGGDLAVIKAENAGRYGFKRTEFSRVKNSTVAHLTRSRLYPGDLLMVFVGAGTGNVARVPDDQPYFLGPNIAMIRVTSELVSPGYLELFLRSPLGNAIALGFAKAVAQPSLSMGTIRMISIAIPSLSEQLCIVAEVERRLSIIEELEAAVKVNLARADRLRQSILSQAFNGKFISNGVRG
ncbi:putative Restriction modification system DNA specificity domain-containing protein [Candidatus Nitrospira nitrosa]|uniref:Putative Restriction modification system DNA specificity domain-containing protein n=1 Tax=Candidatus Nitrospira nitrosa TaxID=1742972 RepID=A0A0S4LSE6_9BACT|nr:restriction endonuclease subunit S [Candidatus Nitrospira nitrosa]CUS39594.1 putative Restriction modification system DNA specificity domain-containing protein [Candidatus Nitrospira nitrosa]